jgi:zinc protease
MSKNKRTQPEFVQTDGGIQEYKLSNGLKVLLVENHSAPVATVLVVYKVGSRNEAVGYTGSTHFLEHMLFRGTPNYNKSKGTQIAQVLSKEGANFNATTWLDRTTYYETVPAEKLELALDIESERMQHAFIRDADRQSEMTVVRNELERDENEPDSIMWKNLFAQAFVAHPYHHPTIGWHSDVEGVPTARLRQFYKEFYHPNNATLVLVGDFETQAALDLVEKKFGSIPSSKKPIPPMYTQEFLQQGERRFKIRRPGQLGIVQMAWHVPAQEHADSYALDVLQDILAEGVNSRLYQNLVESQLAINAGAYNIQLRDPGLFIVHAKVASGISHSEVETAIQAVIAELQKKAPSRKELDRVRNQTKAAFSYSRHGTHQLASMLGEFEATANWQFMLHYLENLEKVKPADVLRVAQTYFKEDNSTVGWFIPEAAESVEFNQRTLPTAAKQAKKAASTKTAGPALIKQKSEVVRKEFSKGAVLLTQENNLDNTVSIQGKFPGGTIFNPRNKYGLAEITASMLKKGSQNYDKLALADALAQMGSSLDFRLGTDHVSFSIRCLGENVAATLALFEDALLYPSFPEAEFEKLKKQRLDRLIQRLDSTDAMAYDLLYRDLYPEDHPLYQPSVATLMQATEKITLQEVKRFYKQHYGHKNMIAAAVGDIDGAFVQKWFKSHLGAWNNKVPDFPEIALIGRQKQGRHLVHTMPDKANVSIFLGHQATLTRNSADFFAATLANQALGQSSLASRLGIRIRDELGLTYGIYSYFADVGRSAGPWMLSVSTNPENVSRTLVEVKKVVDDYLKEGISDKELSDGKSSLIGSYLVNLATHPEIAYRLVQLEQYQFGLDYFQKRAGIIRKVTKAQVNKALRQYLNPDSWSVGIAGNYAPD